jgi:hypothetical protein
MPSGIPSLPDVSSYLNPTGVPRSEWSGIPIMPQALAGQEYDKNTYSYRAPSMAETDVQSYYAGELKGLGWTSTFSAATGSEGGVMVFSKDSSVLTITVVKEDQQILILLILE